MNAGEVERIEKFMNTVPGFTPSTTNERLMAKRLFDIYTMMVSSGKMDIVDAFTGPRSDDTSVVTNETKAAEVLERDPLPDVLASDDARKRALSQDAPTGDVEMYEKELQSGAKRQRTGGSLAFTYPPNESVEDDIDIGTDVPPVPPPPPPPPPQRPQKVASLAGTALVNTDDAYEESGDALGANEEPVVSISVTPPPQPQPQQPQPPPSQPAAVQQPPTPSTRKPGPGFMTTIMRKLQGSVWSDQPQETMVAPQANTLQAPTPQAARPHQNVKVPNAFKTPTTAAPAPQLVPTIAPVQPMAPTYHQPVLVAPQTERSVPKRHERLQRLKQQK